MTAVGETVKAASLAKRGQSPQMVNMPDRSKPPADSFSARPAPTERDARLAEQLRANLRRRKAQARAQSDAASDD